MLNPARQRFSPALIGRDRELALLCEALSAAPALILVEGEAGIGKSRLVREAVGSPAAEGRRVLHGCCHRLRDPFLLGPVVEALRRAGDQPPSRSLTPLLGALRPLLPELAGMLPPELAPIGDARAERHRTFRALRELFEALGPTVCVLEDLHWADEGTLEFLAFLLSEPPSGLALVLTYRAEGLPAVSPVQAVASRVREETLNLTIELSGLAVKDVGRLVGALLEAEAVSEDAASDLHRWTAGNPLALEEVIGMLRERGQLVLNEGRLTSAPLRVEVPPTIREAVRERLERLDRDGRVITHAAAVLATSVPEDLLRQVAGLPRARGTKALASAVSSGLLEPEPDGRFWFGHVLAAEAVQAEIPALERRRLHLRAARSLESCPGVRPLARLAHHHREAKRPSDWARYAEAAADAATSMGNDREAARLLLEALCAPGAQRARRVRMAIKLGVAALYSVSPQAAIGILQRTLAEENMPRGVRGELRCSLARLQSHAGDGSWREEMVRAVTELGRRPALAAPAMATLAWPTMAEGELKDDIGWLRRASETAARARDPRVKRAVDGQRAAILLSVGDPEGWDVVSEIPQQATSIEDKAQLLRDFHNFSVVALNLGHYRQAESFLAGAARIDNDLEHVSWGPWLQSTRISLDWRAGRWQGLESRARELIEATVARPALSLGNELILGSVLLARGRVEEAEQIFARALERARPRRWMSTQVVAAAKLARIRLAGGDAQAAAELSAPGLEVVRRKGIWVWARDVAPVAVQALLALGAWAQARDLAGEFTAGLRDRDAPAARAAGALCDGAVLEARGRHDAGARSLSRAERLWLELPCPYEAAQVREKRGRCLLGRDDQRGGDLLLGALQTFDGLGASWDAGRVRAELRTKDIALRTPAPGGRRTHRGALTPREAEVARLAGRGAKNREIADTLFLSPRTVEAHMSSALRKLGVDSRGALASLQDDDKPG